MRKISRPALVLGTLVGTLSLGACHSYKDTAIEAVRQNRGDIQACIGEAYQRNGSAKGQMEMKLQVAPDGKVNQFAFTKDEVKDPQFAECVKSRAVQWQLPAPPNGKLEIFSYKFNVSGMK